MKKKILLALSFVQTRCQQDLFVLDVLPDGGGFHEFFVGDALPGGP